MHKTTMKHSLLMVVVCFLLTATLPATPLPTITTTMRLNGILTRVFFKDGDTFKVLEGRLAQKSARVVGINSLETYGPVHEWEENSPEYLLDISNKATIMAQQGEWSCSTDENKDIYGRLLATCNDLALALIKAGYAHAYSIDSAPAKLEYLTAQNNAQEQHQGIWRYGISDYIITSLHSASEEGEPYNRLISTVDGHSEKWYHYHEYEICEKVCLDGGSCMVYVPYTRRFGDNRAECLRPQG